MLSGYPELAGRSMEKTFTFTFTFTFYGDFFVHVNVNVNVNVNVRPQRPNNDKLTVNRQ